MRAATPAFTIEADKPAHDVGPLFFGLITEEINHSFDGAICAELIQNRIFKDDPAAPAHWSAVRHG
ncbi:MAG: hypothetical protein LBM04_00750 [Opitutaceae bacterium]|nr:hypothetical protein [Opitutaceae bacterium]